MRSRRGIVVLLATVAWLGAGCAATRQILPPEPPPQEIAGHYTQGEQSSFFEPCVLPAPDAPGGSMWWVTFTGDSSAQFDAARNSGELVTGERYFVRFMAAATPDGQVVPQGPGVPSLLVKQILEIRLASDSDCPQTAH